MLYLTVIVCGDEMKSRTVADHAIKQIEYYPIFVRCAINSLEKCAILLRSYVSLNKTYQLRA